MSTRPLKLACTHDGDYFKVVTDTYSGIQKLKRELGQFGRSLEGKEISDDHE